MKDIARTVKFLITVIGVVLAFFFGWVKLGNFPFEKTVTYLDPDLTRNLIISIYYTLWVFGCKSDTVVQEENYSVPHGKMALPTKSIFYILGFGVIAGVLLAVVETDKSFAIALDILFVANILGFTYILNFVAPAMSMSRDEFQRKDDAQSYEKLKIVIEYMTGWWQWARFAAGGVVLMLLTIVCFSDYYRDEVSMAVASKIGFIKKRWRG